jgi:uncharacterized protein (DUF433 family)
MGIFPCPNIRFGKPCLTGTRIDVATVVGSLATSESFESVQETYQFTHQQLSVMAAHASEHVPPAVEHVS